MLFLLLHHWTYPSPHQGWYCGCKAADERQTPACQSKSRRDRCKLPGAKSGAYDFRPDMENFLNFRYKTALSPKLCRVFFFGRKSVLCRSTAEGIPHHHPPFHVALVFVFLVPLEHLFKTNIQTCPRNPSTQPPTPHPNAQDCVGSSWGAGESCVPGLSLARIHYHNLLPLWNILQAKAIILMLQ
jgi:hypothetical protein